MSPLTKAVNKQLLPIYGKPHLLSLSILMLADIKILVIVNKGQLPQFQKFYQMEKDLELKLLMLNKRSQRFA